MSTDTYSLRIVSVNGLDVELAYTFGADEMGVSKTFSFWLFVLAEGVLDGKVKGAVAKAFDADDVTDPEGFSRSTEKRAMKVIRKVAIGKSEGGAAKDFPRYLRLKVPDSAPRPVVQVKLTMTEERFAKSVKAGATWRGTAYDPDLNGKAFDYDAIRESDDDEDDDD